MSIVWFSEHNKECIATIYPNNITLNKPACKYIEAAYSVMLGIDPNKKIILIKPLTKDMATRGDISDVLQYRISIRSSYGRISNTDFIKEISRVINESIEKENPKKYNLLWNSEEKLFTIDLKNEIKEERA